MRHLGLGLTYTSAIFVLCLAPLIATASEAETANVPLLCTKEELIAFFPQQVVKSVLVKAHFSEEQAFSIAEELSQKDRELAKMVEEKATKLGSNPLKDLSQRDLAIKIYRETLYEVFAKVLKSHGITNEDQIQTLLDEMQAAKSRLFIECIQRQHSNLP